MCDICSRAARMRLPGWTVRDSNKAIARGWELFFTGDRDVETEEQRSERYGREPDGTPRTYGHRPFELQAVIDEELCTIHHYTGPNVDSQVARHVLRMAMQGDPLTRKALRFLQLYSPREYLALMELHAPEVGYPVPTETR